jgi:hypothetical protein
MFDPLPNNDSCFLKVIKDFPIKQIISEGAIKALAITALPSVDFPVK